MLLLSLNALPAAALQALVSHAVFYAADDSKKASFIPYLELVFEVNPATINWVSHKNAYSAKVITTIEAWVDTGIIFHDQYLLQSAMVADVNNIPQQKILDLSRFYLTPGTVHISLKLEDANKADNVFSFEDSIIVQKPKPITLSDVQFLDTLLASDKPGIFQKNGRWQIPLRDNFIPENQKTLRYNAELYQSQNPLQRLILNAFISKSGGDGAFGGLQHFDTSQAQATHVIDGVFSLETLPSGNYYLHLEVQDSNKKIYASSERFFQLLNPNPVKIERPEDTTPVVSQKLNYLDLSKTFVNQYNASQVRAILKMLQPIGDPSERNAIQDFLRKQDEMYARYFVFNFWKKRNDANPESAWKAYAERVKEVNKLFGNSGKPGYETERGVIYLQFGQPNERVKVENETGALPYELWVYDYLPNQSGKNLFLFYRPAFMVSDFLLLHSTVVGTTRNNNWRSILYPNGRSDKNNRSRAEEYFENR